MILTRRVHSDAPEAARQARVISETEIRLRIKKTTIIAVVTAVLLVSGYVMMKRATPPAISREQKTVAAPSPRYVIPPGSSLRQSKAKELQHLQFFDGTVQIQAHYEFFYDKGLELYELIIYPDRSSIAKLPYLADNGDQGYPFEIYVQDPENVARSMFDRKTISKVQSGAIPSIGGEGVFTIQGYWIGFECDNPAFAARVTTVKRITMKHGGVRYAI